jgi:anti-sigma B factor antagonist
MAKIRPILEGRVRIRAGEVIVKISARQVDKSIILDVSGNIDLSNSPEVRKVLLREIREKGVTRVVLNLTAVAYIDSTGVASLVEGLKASRESGMRFVIFGLNSSSREAFKIVGLLKLFEIYDNEEHAMTS